MAADMTSDQVAKAIDRIAATSSKTEKEALIKTYGVFPQFKRVLVAALDPLVTYGIAKLPVPDPGMAPGANTFEDAPIWQLLDDLAARRLTGDAAREEVKKWLTFLTPESSRLLGQIIVKDLRAGFGESTVNKAIKGLIRDFPYMRCSLPKDAKLDAFSWERGVFSQEKADGMFVNLDYEGGDVVRLSTRQGTPLPLDEFAGLVGEVILRLEPGYQHHGEMLVMNSDDAPLARQIGNGILNSVAQGGSFDDDHYPVFMVWDRVPLSAIAPKGKDTKAYRDRLLGLAVALNDKRKPAKHIRIIPTKVVHSLKQAYDHCGELLKKGAEGTIIKCGTGTWKDGTSKHQVKLKLEFEVDLEVVGFESGYGKNAATFGSLVCQSSCRKLSVSAGSGLTDAMRAEIHANRDAWIGKIITVRANEVLTPSASNDGHSLFLPRFVEAREDKTVADTLDRVIAQRNAAIEAAAVIK